MNTIPLQRNYSFDQALVLAESCANHCNISLDLSESAKLGEFSTYLCNSNNHELKLSFRGAGSGFKQEALIKAVYESLEENLLYASLARLDAENIYYFSASSCPTLKILKNKALLPDSLLSADHNKLVLPWLKLKNITACKDTFYYPLALMFPQIKHSQHQDPALLSALANSTGIAIGATFNEAIIHGINDWIERDAYGLFLLSTVITKKKPARSIIKETLPASLKNSIDMIEQKHLDQLFIINITTDYGIPAFLVSFTNQSVPVQPSGLGASLSKTCALEQALFEALQARDRYNTNTIEARNKTLKQYQNQPILLKAFKCDLLELQRNNMLKETKWEEISSIPFDDDLQSQIEFMTQHLKAKGADIYYDTIFQYANGVTLVYVLVIGIETFGMMREGLYIPIRERGRKVIHER